MALYNLIEKKRKEKRKKIVKAAVLSTDRKSTRLNSSHTRPSRMPSSA